MRMLSLLFVPWCGPYFLLGLYPSPTTPRRIQADVVMQKEPCRGHEHGTTGSKSACECPQTKPHQVDANGEGGQRHQGQQEELAQDGPAGRPLHLVGHLAAGSVLVSSVAASLLGVRTTDGLPCLRQRVLSRLFACQGGICSKWGMRTVGGRGTCLAGERGDGEHAGAGLARERRESQHGGHALNQVLLVVLELLACRLRMQDPMFQCG